MCLLADVIKSIYSLKCIFTTDETAVCLKTFVKAGSHKDTFKKKTTGKSGGALFTRIKRKYITDGTAGSYDCPVFRKLLLKI